MIKRLVPCLFICLSQLLVCKAYAQKDTARQSIYRATETKVNDLIHTKLDVRFDYDKSWMYGKAWITLKPHFYPTDSVSLDAKGMTINQVALSVNGTLYPLSYSYDSMNLHIALNRKYNANQTYIVYVSYISKPNDYKAEHPSLMPGEKGLYFINPKGSLKEWPIQIWTQGETEANSYWVPTIDKPNQKTTNEIAMTVPAKYQTLSNGLLVNKKINSDGTRTDTWKMDLPHAPYLMFMAVGDYAIIKDKYKNKEVNYYVEKEYAPFAKRIFGHTPEMMSFFSKITGVDFPWPKYAQITGRDYIFGAMENTSATLHQESSQQDARQLVDGNVWEEVIAHELFHQWFGDYVTAESWSNITVNESFADYSETLWSEYKYGKEAGQAQIYTDRNRYLVNPANANKNLVRFHYQNALDVFDAVGYQKGGCILHMLRNYIGDSAFFSSLKLYLTQNKFKSAEAQNLRLAFEEVTGQDLNWFFNQWYYNAGHPKLDISYNWDPSSKTTQVLVKQVQNGIIFKLPFAVDVYEGGSKKRYSVWMSDSTATYTFATNTAPDLINVDAENVLLCEKVDHKIAKEFMFQYQNAASYIDRREAIDFFLDHPDEPTRLDFLKMALNDKNDRLQSFVLTSLVAEPDSVKNRLKSEAENLAKHGKKPLVRADAIALLGSMKDASYRSLFLSSLYDSSYSVAGNSLRALANIDSMEALTKARSLSTRPAKAILLKELLYVLSNYGAPTDYAYVYNNFRLAGMSEKLDLLEPLATVLSKEKDSELVWKQVDMLQEFREGLPAFISEVGTPVINNSLAKIASEKQAAGEKALSEHIYSLFPPDARVTKKK